MPIDWKAVESRERLMAALIVVHNIEKFNYNHLALAFGQGATYDSIESQFRKSRKLAEQLRKDLTGRGIDLSTAPRGRQPGSEAATPSRVHNLKTEGSTRAPSQTSAGSGTPSRKRAAAKPKPNNNKRPKKEVSKAEEIIDVSSDDEENDYHRQHRRLANPASRRPRLSGDKELANAVSMVAKQEATDASFSLDEQVGQLSAIMDHPRSRPSNDPYLSTSNGISSDGMANEDDNDEEEEIDLPLPAGRRTYQQQQSQHRSNQSFQSSSDELSRPWIHDTNNQSSANPSPSTFLPSSPTLPRTTPRNHTSFPQPLENETETSHIRKLFSDLPSSRLYRDPHSSTTTSLSHTDKDYTAPFLPRRTASHSTPSPFPPTRFSSVSNYRPTTADFQLPPGEEEHYSFASTGWSGMMGDLNLEMEKDERGIPIIDFGGYGHQHQQQHSRQYANQHHHSEEEEDETGDFGYTHNKGKGKGRQIQMQSPQKRGRGAMNMKGNGGGRQHHNDGDENSYV